jgi:hypothetical protein
VCQEDRRGTYEIWKKIIPTEAVFPLFLLSELRGRSWLLTLRFFGNMPPPPPPNLSTTSPEPRGRLLLDSIPLVGSSNHSSTSHCQIYMRASEIESWHSKICSWVPRNSNQEWQCWRGPAATYSPDRPTKDIPEPNQRY